MAGRDVRVESVVSFYIFRYQLPKSHVDRVVGRSEAHAREGVPRCVRNSRSDAHDGFMDGHAQLRDVVVSPVRRDAYSCVVLLSRETVLQ